MTKRQWVIKFMLMHKWVFLCGFITTTLITLISIAHRLSSILDCDKVMVLKAGAAVAFDTHENLRNRNETYDLLFHNQYMAG